MNIQKPWIGTDGKILSDDELKAICKNWSAAIWEQYLTSIEKKPRQEDEVLVGDPVGLRRRLDRELYRNLRFSPAGSALHFHEERIGQRLHDQADIHLARPVQL